MTVRSTSSRAAQIEQIGISEQAEPQSLAKILIAAFFVALPAILFYAMLFRQALNVPFQDDYEALFDFLNHMAGLRGVSAKTSYFLSAQYNEYKLFFEHGLIWLQLTLFGHIDVRLLCALGNGFVLLLAILLWKMFLPGHKDLASRLAFFIPVSWLLFQLQYVETLNWSMGSLQNLPVLVFSLGAIYLLLLPRATLGSYCAALGCLILAIASSGNGFLMIPVGALILAVGRRFARAGGWFMISVGCVVVYAYHYHVLPEHPVDRSVLFTMLRPLYAVAFIGDAAKAPLFMYTGSLLSGFLRCLCLGAALCLFFFYMARRGYIRRNPLISYCVLFLLLTALGVATLRSGIGMLQSLDSRYGIYSVLLLIFAWFMIVEEFLLHERGPVQRLIFAGCIAVATLFSLHMDARGQQYLAGRNRRVVRGMIAYEHPFSSGSDVGPILMIPRQNSRMDEFDRRAPVILEESTKLGIYRPPTYY